MRCKLPALIRSQLDSMVSIPEPDVFSAEDGHQQLGRAIIQVGQQAARDGVADKTVLPIHLREGFALNPNRKGKTSPGKFREK